VSFWTDPKSAFQNPSPSIGELGEQLVAQWLQTQNWVILHHRWRCRWGEIDLIAQQVESGKAEDGESERTGITTPSSLVAFIEVKTRASGNWDADGRLAITPQKQAKLWQAAQLFLANYPELATLPCRFDVALVNYQRISVRSHPVSPAPLSVISNATQPPIQLGQPIVTNGYRLLLQDYIPSAFDGL
jgi:putative endonuclease